jgi:hypothetical protein
VVVVVAVVVVVVVGGGGGDNFCDEHKKVRKPATVEDHSWYMAYVKKATEWLIPVQLLGEHTSGQKGICFHLLNLTTLNSL